MPEVPLQCVVRECVLLQHRQYALEQVTALGPASQACCAGASGITRHTHKCLGWPVLRMHSLLGAPEWLDKLSMIIHTRSEQPQQRLPSRLNMRGKARHSCVQTLPMYLANGAREAQLQSSKLADSFSLTSHQLRAVCKSKARKVARPTSVVSVYPEHLRHLISRPHTSKKGCNASS